MGIECADQIAPNVLTKENYKLVCPKVWNLLKESRIIHINKRYNLHLFLLPLGRLKKNQKEGGKRRKEEEEKNKIQIQMMNRRKEGHVWT